MSCLLQLGPLMSSPTPMLVLVLMLQPASQWSGFLALIHLEAELAHYQSYLLGSQPLIRSYIKVES
jgi:hypothetical protein